VLTINDDCRWLTSSGQTLPSGCGLPPSRLHQGTAHAGVQQDGVILGSGREAAFALVNQEHEDLAAAVLAAHPLNLAEAADAAKTLQQKLMQLPAFAHTAACRACAAAHDSTCLLSLEHEPSAIQYAEVISQVPAVQRLHVRLLEEANEDTIDAIAQRLAGAGHVQHVKLECPCLRAEVYSPNESASKLLCSLPGMQSLKLVSDSKGLDLASLADALASCTRLTSLHALECEVSKGRGLGKFAAYLAQMGALQHLYLLCREAPVPSHAVSPQLLTLVPDLAALSCLTLLYLGAAGDAVHRASTVAAALVPLTRLQQLSLSGITIDSDSVAVLGRRLAALQRLTGLDFGRIIEGDPQRLGHESAMFLDHLQALPALQELAVWSSSRDGSLAPVAASIGRMTGLQSLLWGYHHALDDAAAQALASSLRALTRLTSVHFEELQMKDEEVALLVTSLAALPGLRKVKLALCTMSEGAYKKVEETLAAAGHCELVIHRLVPEDAVADANEYELSSDEGSSGSAALSWDEEEEGWQSGAASEMAHSDVEPGHVGGGEGDGATDDDDMMVIE
jgi:hypothetical protein